MSVMPRDHEWTVDDLVGTPDDGMRYELVDGDWVHAGSATGSDVLRLEHPFPVELAPVDLLDP